MSRPWVPAVVVGVSAVVCAVVIAGYRWYAGEVLDDLEGPFRPVEWTFHAGTEFPGAGGGYSRSPRAARSGRWGAEVRFEFLRGGRYVQVLYPLRYRKAITGIRFWVRGSAGNVLALRVRDAREQVFQKELGVVPRKWTEFKASFDDWTESWGGPNDGLLRQPVRGVALVVVNSSPQTGGTVYFDEVRRWNARVAVPPARRHLPPHPRLMVSGAELAAARTRVRREAWAKALLAELEKAAAEELAKGIRIPDTGGQCEHWYACPVHGASLRMEGPRRHVCPVDGKVFTGWPYDAVAVALEHKRLRRLVRDFALLYGLTGDRRWAEPVRRILLGYADRYASYPLRDIEEMPGRGGKAWAQSLDEAVWLVHLVQAADLVWNTLSEEERERFLSRLVRPAVNGVLRPQQLRFHNIQCWHNAAIGLSGYLMGDRDMISEAVDGARGYWYQLRHMVNQDGQWREGSWGYHFYALEPLTALAEAAHHCGENLYSDALRSMFLAPIHAAMPDATLPAFNDSQRLSLGTRDIYEIAFRRFSDASMAVPLSRQERAGFRALLYGVRPLPDVKQQRVESGILTDSGYAILARAKGGSVAWVCVKYGPHGGDHGHYDKNSLVFYHNGSMILDDPGVGAYLTPLTDGWFKTTVAHNTACVEQQSQAEATGRVVRFHGRGPVPMCLTDAGEALGRVRFRRAVYLLSENGLAVLDLFHAGDGQARLLDLFWHPSGSWLHAPRGKPVPAEDRRGYRYLRSLQGTVGRRWQGSVLNGGRAVRLILASTTDATFAWGTGIGQHAGDRVPIVIVRQGAASAAILTVVVAQGSGTTAEGALVSCRAADGEPLEPGVAAAARVRVAGQSFLLVANPEGLLVRCNGYWGRSPLVAKTGGP